jgi:hypothetical protein
MAADMFKTPVANSKVRFDKDKHGATLLLSCFV